MINGSIYPISLYWKLSECQGTPSLEIASKNLSEHDQTFCMLNRRSAYIQSVSPSPPVCEQWMEYSNFRTKSDKPMKME